MIKETETELTSLRASIRELAKDIADAGSNSERGNLIDRHYIMLKRFFERSLTEKIFFPPSPPPKTITLGQFEAETEAINPSHQVVLVSCENAAEAPIYDVTVVDKKVVLTISHEPFNTDTMRCNDSREMLYILAHRCKWKKESHRVDAAFAVIATHLGVAMPKTPIVDAELAEPVVSVNGVPAQRTDVGMYAGGPLPPVYVPSNFGPPWPPPGWPNMRQESPFTFSKSDAVVHPPHYNQGKFEVIDVIDDWRLGFAEGNAVKYIARAKHKNNELEDLKKARWYLDHAIKLLEPGVFVAEMVDRAIVTLKPKIAPVSPGEMICQILKTKNAQIEDMPGGTHWRYVIEGRQALRESVEIPQLAYFFTTSNEFWISIRDNFNVYLASIGRPPLGTPQETT